MQRQSLLCQSAPAGAKAAHMCLVPMLKSQGTYRSWGCVLPVTLHSQVLWHYLNALQEVIISISKSSIDIGNLARNKAVPSPDALHSQVLKQYYQALRQGEARSAARTTIRMLESLVRIAQVGVCTHVSMPGRCVHSCEHAMHYVGMP